MRLFIGVELDEAVRAAAIAIGERVRQRLKSARVDVNARWVAEENLHITIWFIGEANDERAADIRNAIARSFGTRAFDLVLAGCGAFPPSGPPRVFWVGTERGGDALSRLYAEVAERLGPLGYEPERRPYSAHLTVARIKDTPRGSTAAIRRVLADTPADAGGCRIAAVTLFRSHLSPKGSTYEPLIRVPLQT